MKSIHQREWKCGSCMRGRAGMQRRHRRCTSRQFTTMQKGRIRAPAAATGDHNTGEIVVHSQKGVSGMILSL
jgi:hypothetical protein